MREALEFIEGDLSRAARVAESERAEMTLGVLREALARVRALLAESQEAERARDWFVYSEDCTQDGGQWMLDTVYGDEGDE